MKEIIKKDNHIFYKIECDAKLSDKCKEYTYSREDNRKKNIVKYGKFHCDSCARIYSHKIKNSEIVNISKNIELNSKIDHSKFTLESHEIITCGCEKGISEKCLNIVKRTYRDYVKNLNKNENKYVCFYCSRKHKYSSDGNPNKKYNYGINFKNYDKDSKIAYFLGWLASDGFISHLNGSIILSIHKKDIEILDYFKTIFKLENPIKFKKNSSMVALSLNDKLSANEILNIIGIYKNSEDKSSKKSSIVRMPTFLDDECKMSFIRGYFEGDGNIRKISSRGLDISIASNSQEMLKDLHEVFGLHSNIHRNQISWYSDNAMKILDNIYTNAEFKLSRKYNSYILWKEKYKTKYKNNS